MTDSKRAWGGAERGVWRDSFAGGWEGRRFRCPQWGEGGGAEGVGARGRRAGQPDVTVMMHLGGVRNAIQLGGAGKPRVAPYE